MQNGIFLSVMFFTSAGWAQLDPSTFLLVDRPVKISSDKSPDKVIKTQTSEEKTQSGKDTGIPSAKDLLSAMEQRRATNRGLATTSKDQ